MFWHTEPDILHTLLSKFQYQYFSSSSITPLSFIIVPNTSYAFSLPIGKLSRLESTQHLLYIGGIFSPLHHPLTFFLLLLHTEYQILFQSPFPRILSHILRPLLKHRTINTLRFSRPKRICINILHTSNLGLSPLPSNTMRSSSMFLSRLVINKQLPMLSIAKRLVLGGLDNAEPATPAALGFLEYVVYFFQGTVGGFWVAEVDYGNDECVAGVG